MTDHDDSPQWAKESKKKLKEMAPKIAVIKKQGQAEIRRGLEKVEESDKLQNEADYLGRVLSIPHEPKYWNDEIITVSGPHLLNSISILDQNVDRMMEIAVEGGEIGEARHVQFVSSLPSTDSSGGTAIYLGASIESRFVTLESSYKPVLQESTPARLNSRDVLYQELRQALVEYGDEFVLMLDGSEAALGNNNPDSLHQAAHSMRDCFQQLIEYLAPSKVVKSQPWFKPTEGAPGGISRRSRLQYMLYGSGEKVDEDTIQQFDSLAEISKQSLDLCIARAHGHDPLLKNEEVIYAVDQARNELLNVIKLYNDFRKR